MGVGWVVGYIGAGGGAMHTSQNELHIHSYFRNSLFWGNCFPRQFLWIVRFQSYFSAWTGFSRIKSRIDLKVKSSFDCSGKFFDHKLFSTLMRKQKPQIFTNFLHLKFYQKCQKCIFYWNVFVEIGAGIVCIWEKRFMWLPQWGKAAQ